MVHTLTHSHILYWPIAKTAGYEQLLCMAFIIAEVFITAFFPHEQAWIVLYTGVPELGQFSSP